MGQLVGMKFFGKLSDTPPVIVDLPASDGSPVEIDFTKVTVVQVVISAKVPFFLSWAETAADGLVVIASDSTRGYFPSGVYAFDVANSGGKKFYIVSADAAEVDGVSYMFMEAS